MLTGVRILASLVILSGVILLALAPIIGPRLFDTLYGVEPLTYFGALLLVAGLGSISATYLIQVLLAEQPQTG